jgi:hypothetical protein
MYWSHRVYRATGRKTGDSQIFQQHEAVMSFGLLWTITTCHWNETNRTQFVSITIEYSTLIPPIR